MNSLVLGGRHVGIPVSNMDKMIFFYKNLLGFSIKSNEIEEGNFISSVLKIQKAKVLVIKMIAPDGWMLELLQYLEPIQSSKAKYNSISDTGNAHIALTVENLDHTYNYLKNNFIKFLEAPCISPSGKAKVCFCQDPESNFVELVELL